MANILERLKTILSLRRTSSPTAPNSETGIIIEPRVEQGQWDFGVKTHLATNGLEIKIDGRTPDAPPDFRLGVLSPVTFTLDAGVGRNFFRATVKSTPRLFRVVGRAEMGITDAAIPTPKLPVVEGAFYDKGSSRATVELGMGTNIFGVSSGRFSVGVLEQTSFALKAGYTESHLRVGADIIRGGRFVVFAEDGQTPLVIAE